MFVFKMKLRNIVILFFAFVFVLGFSLSAAYAQCFNVTNQNCFGFVYGSALWCDSGVEAGDEIGAFVSDVPLNNGCVGTFKVTTPGSYGAMSIYCDDPTTQQKDGVLMNDVVTFKICRNGVILNCKESIVWNTSYVNDYFALNLSTDSPSADFSADPLDGCAPLAVSFTNLSINASSYLWEFDDGETSQEQNPSHTYLFGGIYNVCLTASNECGSDKKCLEIVVGKRPIADYKIIEEAPYCAGQEISFQDLSSHRTTHWKWDFGDGNTSEEQHPIHTYVNGGTYNVCLTASNYCGSNTMCMEVLVDKLAVEINASAYTGSVPLEVTLAGITNCVSQPIYSWDLGDGTVSSEQSLSHVYDKPGIYKVVLSVVDETNGKEMTQEAAIEVQPFNYTQTPQFVFVWGDIIVDAKGLEVGDWVGAFADDVIGADSCIGAYRIEQPGVYGAMAVYGDEPATSQKEGAAIGDEIRFRAWDTSEGLYIDLCTRGPDKPIWTNGNDELNINLTNNCQQEIPLCEGWNLISFQVNKCFYEVSPTVFIPSGVVKEDVGILQDWLSDDTHSPLRDATDPTKAGDWQRVTSFDGEGAHIMDKNLPAFINTLKYLSAGYGYWIKMNKPGSLVLEGQFVPADTIVELQSGWNLIGYIPHDICYGDIDQEGVCPYTNGQYKIEEGILYCPINPLAYLTFSSIHKKFRRITSFDCCYGAMIFDTELPESVNTLHYIGPKYGYWIKIDERHGANLVFPNNCSGILLPD